MIDWGFSSTAWIEGWPRTGISPDSQGIQTRCISPTSRELWRTISRRSSLPFVWEGRRYSIAVSALADGCGYSHRTANPYTVGPVPDCSVLFGRSVCKVVICMLPEMWNGTRKSPPAPVLAHPRIRWHCLAVTEEETAELACSSAFTSLSGVSAVNEACRESPMQALKTTGDV